MKKYNFEYAPIRRKPKRKFNLKMFLGFSLAALFLLSCYLLFWSFNAHLADESPVSGVLLMAFTVVLFLAIKEFKQQY